MPVPETDALSELTVLAPPAPATTTPRVKQPLRWRLLQLASAYLPLLLMALLALATWWLVKNTPLAGEERTAAPARHEPDYEMHNFAVQRFTPQGPLRAQIEGDTLRHFPDTDTVEIDNVRLRAVSPDGRITLATARRAIANGAATEVQLLGGAEIVAEATATEPAINFRGEFLHAFQYSERVRSHLPVVVTQGGTEIRADAMAYDNLAGVLDLKGHVKAVLAPAAAAEKK